MIPVATHVDVPSYVVDTVLVMLYNTELQLTMAGPSVCVTCIQMIPVATHADVSSYGVDTVLVMLYNTELQLTMAGTSVRVI